MLYGQGQIFLREVEHVEDTVLLATVLAMVDGAYHLYDSLALMHHLRLAILSDDGQLVDTPAAAGAVLHDDNTLRPQMRVAAITQFLIRFIPIL